MATGKRYYWIKLKDTFMTSDTIDFFMSQPNGANYVVLYQMLLLKTINTDGRLARQIGEVLIPYDVEKIARDCKWFSEDTIRVALELYHKFGLIYEDTDGVLVMRDHGEMVGSATDYADKKRRYRIKQDERQSGDNVPQNVPIDIRDKDIKILDKESKKKPPTLQDIEDYIREKNMTVDPKVFFDYYEEGHWAGVKNWKQKLITWNSHEKPTAKKSNGFHNFDERKDSLDSDVLDTFNAMMNAPEVSNGK